MKACKLDDIYRDARDALLELDRVYARACRVTDPDMRRWATICRQRVRRVLSDIPASILYEDRRPPERPRSGFRRLLDLIVPGAST
ncbi:MAG: hypothetical protein ABJG86_11145 [Nitratireductor sp.]